MPLRGTIVVDENLCKACELCLEACPQHVIGLNAEIITPRGFHLIKDECTGCGICALVCPEAAITVYREKRGAQA